MTPPGSLKLLDDKVAVVTGAAGGIGRSFAVGLAAKGAKVVCLDLAQDGLLGTESEIAGNGGSAITVVTDVREEASIHGAFAKVIERFGTVDVLVNNAGIATTPMRLHEIPLADWDRLMAVNLRGAFSPSRSAAAHAEKQARRLHCQYRIYCRDAWLPILAFRYSVQITLLRRAV